MDKIVSSDVKMAQLPEDVPRPPIGTLSMDPVL